MVERKEYLEQLKAWKDEQVIKVVTGILRCGQSTLLSQYQQQLKTTGITDEQIVSVNFEELEYEELLDYRKLYSYLKERLCAEKTTYIFLDEIQKVPSFEKVVDSLYVKPNVDIYITGSNAYMLSGDLATLLTGRYVEIKMLPLSFAEFIDFHGFTIQEVKSTLGGTKKQAVDADGTHYELREIFDAYMRYGGMPGIADVGLEQDKALTLLDGIYSTVIVRDILEREKRRGQRQITDTILLKKIILFLADNIGRSVSVSSIGNTLVNESILDEGRRKTKPSAHTVQAYVNALLEAYFFYDIKRFDIKGKEFLRTLGKYYIVDIGLRNYLLGFRNRDSGHAIENVVYFELLCRGYDVAIGKVGTAEVDFIATKADEKLYVQVTESMESETVRARELAPLQKIADNYEKIVLSLNPGLDSSYEGIKSLNLIDWLLESK